MMFNIPSNPNHSVSELSPHAGLWLTVHQMWPPGPLPVRAQLRVVLVDTPRAEIPCVPWCSGVAQLELQGSVLSLFCPLGHAAAPGQLLWAGSKCVDRFPGVPDPHSDRARVHLWILSQFP